MSWRSMISRMTPSSKYLVRNYQCLWTLRLGDSWHTFNHSEVLINLEDKLKLIYYDDLWCQRWPNPPSTWSVTTITPKVWTLITGVPWHNSNYSRELKFGTQLEDGVILDTMGHHEFWLFTCVLEVYQEPSSFKSLFWGHYWFLARYMDDGVVLYIMDCHDMWFYTWDILLKGVPNVPPPHVQVGCLAKCLINWWKVT